jgi:hypothetical protein
MNWNDLPALKFFDNEGNTHAYQRVGAGKSFQFIQVADGPDAQTFIPGSEMLGQNFAFDQELITIDDPIRSHRAPPLDQERLVDWSTLRPLGMQIVRKVKEQVEDKLAIMAVHSARTAAKTNSVSGDTFTVHNGGNVVERTADTVAIAYPATVAGAQAFRRDASDLAKLFDEDNVPEEGRFLYISPQIHTSLQADTQLFDKDLSALSGDIATRVLGRLAGFWLIKTNRLPSTLIDESTFEGGSPAKYHGDFSVAGAVGQPAAVALCGAQEGEAGIGMVDGTGLITFAEVDERREVMFMKAGITMGIGKLSPYCAGEIRVDAA